LPADRISHPPAKFIESRIKRTRRPSQLHRVRDAQDLADAFVKTHKRIADLAVELRLAERGFESGGPIGVADPRFVWHPLSA